MNFVQHPPWWKLAPCIDFFLQAAWRWNSCSLDTKTLLSVAVPAAYRSHPESASTRNAPLWCSSVYVIPRLISSLWTADLRTNNGSYGVGDCISDDWWEDLQMKVCSILNDCDRTHLLLGNYYTWILQQISIVMVTNAWLIDLTCEIPSLWRQ